MSIEFEPGESFAPKSVLAKLFVDEALARTKEMLELGDEQFPILHLEFEGRAPMRFPLAPDETAEERQITFTSFQHLFSKNGWRLNAALYQLMQSLPRAMEPERKLRIVTAKHTPRRLMAISFVGRNEEGTRFTHVVQPFRWKRTQRVIFLEPLVAAYAVDTERAANAAQVLEPLFPKRTHLLE